MNPQVKQEGSNPNLRIDRFIFHDDIVIPFKIDNCIPNF